MNCPFNIGVTVCGSPDSGKTAFIKRLIDDEFSETKIENYVEHQKLKQMTIDNFPIQVSIIERGNESFMKQASTDPASRGDILFYLFNATDKESFDNTLNLFNYFVRLNDSAVMYLVASFTDCGKRAVSMTEGKASVNDQDGFYAEISSKTGDGIQELLQTAIHNYLQSQHKSIQKRVQDYKAINKNAGKKTKKGGCLLL
ncbi:Ras family protein [Entamoeba histolytica]|uniref:Ras family protein n=1 Tax=Entamoeba histolytica TaxID=5759 RepID=A0A175JSN7_ENTHI|nr:Ras family protein [Entamoeba histolytica]